MDCGRSSVTNRIHEACVIGGQDLYVTDLRVDFRMPYNTAVDDWNIGCRCAADAPDS